jgi:hypothetical protein
MELTMINFVASETPSAELALAAPAPAAAAPRVAPVAAITAWPMRSMASASGPLGARRAASSTARARGESSSLMVRTPRPAD